MLEYLVCLLLIQISGTKSDDETSDVIVLTEQNFDDLTATGSWILEFYAPWCSHCKSLAPIYDRVATNLKGQISLGKVDCTTNRDLQERFEVKSFPTLKFWREGENRTYRGPRTEDALTEFGKNMTKPAVDVLTAKDFGRIQKDYPVSFLYLGEKGPEFKVFERLAYLLQGQFRFVAEDRAIHGADEKNKDKELLGFNKKPDKKLYSQTDAKENQAPLVVELSKGGSRDKFTGPWTVEDFRTFVMDHKLPLVSYLSGQTFDEVTHAGKRTVIAATKPDDPQTDAYLVSLTELAKLYKEEFIMANLDAVQFNEYVAKFGFEDSDYPTLFILDAVNEYYWLPKGSRHVDVRDQQLFLDSVLSGQIQGINVYPWYSPARYTKWLQRNLSETHLMILVVAATLGFGAILVFACIYAGDFGPIPNEEAEGPDAPRRPISTGKPTGKKPIKGE